jgi:hypothetical protein
MHQTLLVLRLKLYIISFNRWLVGELIWIEVSFPRYKILVCVVYRSPSAINPFWNNFHYSVEKAIESSLVVITGDLNVDLLIETNHRLNEIMYNYFIYVFTRK